MTKRSWKLEEFVAHGESVTCLALGRKSGRVMVTGGDDKKVNLWAVGRPNCIMSLSGHSSPIAAVMFSNAEDQVVAGSLSGAIKIWDLEAAKIVHTLSGHKSGVSSLNFHPYMASVASGSFDSNVKLWDVRRKGCIFTYKGHSNGVNSVRFSPDGRWIASGGEDGVVKIWDLTAGKLLVDLKRHTAPVSCLEFHPNELLLASGSADRTVIFWDLEKFQLVSVTDGNASSIRSICYHPDGLCLYAACADVLKVYSWEPSRCHDSLTTGWGRIADVNIAKNQLIGASFSQTSVSTFVVDITRVQPLGGPASVQSTPQAIPRQKPPTQIIDAKVDTTEEIMKPKDKTSPVQTNNIKDDKKYEDIFRPHKELSHTPPKDGNGEPFQAPSDELMKPKHTVVISKAAVTAAAGDPGVTLVVDKKAAVVTRTPSTKDRDISSAPKDKDTSSTSVVRSSSARRVSNPVAVAVSPVKEVQKIDSPAPPSACVASKKASALPDATYVASPAAIPVEPAEPAKRQAPAVRAENFIPPEPSKEQAEGDMLATVARGHDAVMHVMRARLKNLQTIRALWTPSSIKVAVDSAMTMGDRAVVVDLINTLLASPHLLTLDICCSLLPKFLELILSGYDSYLTTVALAMILVLKNFGPIIKTNISAPPSSMIDISREERYEKCRVCYKHLIEVWSTINTNELSSKLASRMRELRLLMAQFD